MASVPSVGSSAELARFAFFGFNSSGFLETLHQADFLIRTEESVEEEVEVTGLLPDEGDPLSTPK